MIQIIPSELLSKTTISQKIYVFFIQTSYIVNFKFLKSLTVTKAFLLQD